MENNCDDNGFAQKIFLVVLGAVLGYLLNNYLNKKNTQRKEDWELLENLKEQIGDCAKEAIEYYAAGIANPKQAINIQRLVGRTASEFHQFIKAIDPNCKNNSLVIKFRQSITSNLEKVTSIAPNLDDIKDEILDCELKLGDFSWKKYSNKYRKKSI